MDLQADINWIKAEIEKVRDPQLIMAFKNLLNYRNSKELEVDTIELSDSQKEELDRRLNAYDSGKTELLSWEEVKSNIRTRAK